MTAYLTDKAIFQCSCNPGITFRCSDSGQRKIRWQGQTVLTKNASLSPQTSPPIPCPILTALAQGTPTFCKNKLGPWLPNGIAPLVLAGSPLLTDTATRLCLVCPGQKVSLLKDFGNLAGLLHKGRAPRVNWPKAMSLLAPAEIPEVAEWKPFGGADSGDKGGEAAGQATRKAQEGESSAQESVQDEAREEEKEEQEEDGLKYRCPDCGRPCELQEKYRGKRPPWDEAPLDLGTDSITLRKNYKLYLKCQSCADEKCANAKARNAQEGDAAGGAPTRADKIYCGLDKKYYRFQAHHIISGRQVFKPLPQGQANSCENENILRMAHVCDYDVNRAANCIMLVSNSEDEEADERTQLRLARGAYDEKEAEAAKKALNAYESMQGSKLQWHVGNHSYKFSAEAAERLKARIKFYTKKDSELSSYAELLGKKLEKMNQRIDREVNIEHKPICPRTFIRQMDALSAEIRSYLEAFAAGYHLSHPYYVSKEAYNFAFQLPQAFRIITAQRKPECLLLKKFSISRKMNGAINVAPLSPPKGKEAEGYAEKSFREPLDRKELVEFCANLEYFIFFGQTGPATMPFYIDPRQFRKVSAGREDAEEYVKANAYELIVWIRDNPLKYKAGYARVLERLAEENA